MRRRAASDSGSPAWLVACRGLAVGGLAIAIVIGVLAVFGDANGDETVAVAAPRLPSTTDATIKVEGAQATTSTTPAVGAPAADPSADPAASPNTVGPAGLAVPQGGSGSSALAPGPVPAAESPGPPAPDPGPPPRPLPGYSLSRGGAQLYVTIRNLEPGQTVRVSCQKIYGSGDFKAGVGSFSAPVDGSGSVSGACNTAESGVDMAGTHVWAQADGYPPSDHYEWEHL